MQAELGDLLLFGGLWSAFWLLLWLVLFLRVEVVRLSNVELISGVVEQLGKAKAEIVGRIAVLEAAVAAGEDLSGPLAELVAAAQGLDDVVPDEVVPVEG